MPERVVNVRIPDLDEAKINIAELRNRVDCMEEEMMRRADNVTVDSIESRLNMTECNANYTRDMCSYLEDKITPSSIIGDLNEELKLLAKYKALGNPEQIEDYIRNLKKEKNKLAEDRDEMIAAAANLSNYISALEKSTFSIDYVKTEILDMINNYDERTNGVAMSEAGNSRFFYVLALSGLMNIFTEREKELNA